MTESQQRGSVISARVPDELFVCANAIAKKNRPPQSLSKFVLEAIENEVSRRSMTKPMKSPTLADVVEQIDLIKIELARQIDMSRVNAALLQAVAQQVGAQNQ